MMIHIIVMMSMLKSICCWKYHRFAFAGWNQAIKITIADSAQKMKVKPSFEEKVKSSPSFPTSRPNLFTESEMQSATSPNSLPLCRIKKWKKLLRLPSLFLPDAMAKYYWDQIVNSRCMLLLNDGMTKKNRWHCTIVCEEFAFVKKNGGFLPIKAQYFLIPLSPLF